MLKKRYEIVGLGGTFDHLHTGHKYLIKLAAQFGQHLHLGITHPKLTQAKPYPELIQAYGTRKKAVEKFCKNQQIAAAFFQLNDLYGPTLNENSKIKALVVTQDTLGGAEKINQAREAMGMNKLPLHICPLLSDNSDQVISSERIRAGEISQIGEIYKSVFTTNLILTQTQRKFFSQIQGEIVKKPNSKASILTCVVGDSSLEKFIKNNWSYDLGVYDKKQQRQSFHSDLINALNPDANTANPAGQISTQLVQNLQSLIDKKTQHIHKLKNKPLHLFIIGEEDLAAVALVLLLPLQARIYYGQPNQGLIELIVSEEKKEEVYQILSNSFS